MKQEDEAEEPRRRVVVEGDGRGGNEPVERALTRVDMLYSAEVLNFDEWDAAKRFREWHFELTYPSEGISSYGLASGRAEPTRKGDRRAKRLTGIEIMPNGKIERGPSKSNRSLHWKYNDALFAMCGVHTDEGQRVIDPQLCWIMVRAITETESTPTQTQVGRLRAPWIKDDGKRPSKQVTAVGASVIKECLAKLAMHFRMVKGEEVR